MIQLAFFGQLLVTLSTLGFVLAIVALAALGYTAMATVEALELSVAPEARMSRRFGARLTSIAVTAGLLLVALLGLRLAGGVGAFGELLLASWLGVGVAASGGALSMCALVASGRARAALRCASDRRLAAHAHARRMRTTHEAAERARMLSCEDLQAERRQAEAAVDRLRASIASLLGIRDGLRSKLAALEAAGPNGPDGAAVRADCARAAEEVTTRIELSERVLEEAQVARFQLLCAEPVRRMLRRRPPRALVHVAAADAPPERVAEARRAVASYLEELSAATASLDDLEESRPEGEPPDDPLERTRRELAAMHDAYSALGARYEVIELRLRCRSEVQELASAAGDLSNQTRSAAVDDGELRSLVAEVERAEAGIEQASRDDPSPAALLSAMARTASAVQSQDAESVEQMLAVMRRAKADARR